MLNREQGLAIQNGLPGSPITAVLESDIISTGYGFTNITKPI